MCEPKESRKPSADFKSEQGDINPLLSSGGKERDI